MESEYVRDGTLESDELRVAGVGSLAEANRFLFRRRLPAWWETRFTVTTALALDAHRALPPDADLEVC
jgi:hypothetical protein